MGVGPQGHAKRAGQTKVSKLEVSLLVNEKVLGLEVTVQDAVRVAVLDARDELVHEALDHVFTEAHALGDRLHVLLEVEVEELEHKVDLVALGDDVKELDDVGVVHLLEEGDLADGGAGHALVLGRAADGREDVPTSRRR